MVTVNGTNGSAPHTLTLITPGVYAPLNTFYLDNKSQDLDIPTFKKHAVRIAQTGVGLVAAGSMGEAPQLTHAERNILVTAAREALDDNNLSHVPLIAGTGASSTRETIELTKEAAKRGATQALVIAPGYFVGAMSRLALKTFFVEVADASPIPIIIYNYPGASAGIDLDTDLISEIAAAAPNIVGIKLTCGSIGKLTRLVNLRPSFGVLGGFVDILGPSLFVHSVGAIAGLANFAPKSCLKLFQLSSSGLQGSQADLKAAVDLQAIVSAGDWALQKGGIGGTKYAIERSEGYGGAPRRPILPFDASEGKGDKLVRDLAALLAYERSL